MKNEDLNTNCQNDLQLESQNSKQKQSKISQVINEQLIQLNRLIIKCSTRRLNSINLTQIENSNLYLCDQSNNLEIYDLNFSKYNNEILMKNFSKVQKFIDFTQNSIELFNPESNFKIVLNLVGMVFIFVQIMTIPFFIVFDKVQSDEFDNFSTFVTIFFFFDILTNFNTSYHDNVGELIVDRKLIFKNYLKTWFMIDFISNFPVDWIFKSNGGDQGTNNMFRILRITRVLRLLRAFKLRQIINNMLDQITFPPIFIAVIQIFKLIFIIVCLAHWIACFFCFSFFSGQIQELWLRDYEEKVGYIIETWQSQYLVGYYWAIVTMISVGYGDITPKTTNSRLFTILIMIFSSGLFGYVMNKIAIIFQELDNRKGQSLSLKNLIKYLKKKELSKDVQYKVKSFIEQYQEQQINASSISEAEFMSFLSENLKENYIKLVIVDVIKICIVNSMENFGIQIIEQIAYKLESKIYNYQELIIEESDQLNQKYLYLQMDNQINIRVAQTNTNLKQFPSKQIIGIDEFLTDKKYNYSVESLNVCSTYRIQRNQFFEIFEQKRFFKAKLQLKEIQTKLMLNINHFQQQCFICNSLNHEFLYCDRLFTNNSRSQTINKYKNFIKKRQPYQRFNQKICSYKVLQKLQNPSNIIIETVQVYKRKSTIIAQVINQETGQSNIKNSIAITLGETFDNQFEDNEIIKNYSDFYKDYNLRLVVKQYNIYLKQEQQRIQQTITKLKKCVSKAFRYYLGRKFRVLEYQNIMGLNIQLIREMAREQKKTKDLEELCKQVIAIYGFKKIQMLVDNYNDFQKEIQN